MRGGRAGAALWGAILAAYVGLIVFWEGAPFALCFDDAYYYFQIARRVLVGQGSTFDGVNLTNGYHPLWLIACLPAFALFPAAQAVRALLVAQVALWSTGLARLAPDGGGEAGGGPGKGEQAGGQVGIGRAVIALIGLSPALIQAGVNGLESALAGAFLAAALATMAARPDPRAGELAVAARLAWLLPWCFLARTDAVFLVAAVALFGPGGWRGRISAVIPAGLVVAAYMGFNFLWFGTATQVSGSIKRLPPEAWRIAAWVLVWGGAAFLLGRVCADTTGDAAPFPRARSYLARTRVFGIFAAMSAGYYLFLQAFPQLWYFGPALLYGLGLLACITEDLAAQAERERLGGARIIAAVFVVPLAALWLWQGARFFDPQTRAAMEADRAAAIWATERLPPGAVIGSWDAGVVGFYSGRRVINLDGLVNSVEFRDLAAIGAAGPWLRAQGLSHLINHDRLEGGAGGAGGSPAAVIAGAERLLSPDLRLTELYRSEYAFKGASNRWGPGLHPMATVVLEVGWPAPPALPATPAAPGAAP